MYKKTNKSWKKHWDFMLWDVLIIEAILFIANHFRNDFSLWNDRRYRMIVIVAALSSILIAFFRDGYHNILKRDNWLEFKDTAIHVTLVMGCVIGALFIIKETAFVSRWVITITLISGIVCCFIWRCLWKKFLHVHLRKKRSGRQMMLLTTSDIAEETIANLTQKDYVDYEIAHLIIMDQNMVGQIISGIPVCAAREDIIPYLHEHVVDEIMVIVSDETNVQEEVLKKCQDMGITTHVNLTSAINGDCVYVEGIANYMVLTTTVKNASPRQLFCKRLMDILGGLVGCVVTGILCIFVIPAIKHADKGPAFFTQTRIGKNGREFKMYKFRSMYRDAEARKQELMDQNEMSGLMFKMENDPRILPGVGHFIRKTSIDEFPQFFNVLKGDISLVGTRPPTLEEYKQYENHHMIRLAAKPGLTGLWQVSGRSDITDFEEVVALDAQYIRDWDLGLDLRILLKTVKLMFSGKGAK